ncbi:MAG: asparagine synthase (glutamine-hydrolyzing) [Pseudomonadales bacterium]
MCGIAGELCLGPDESRADWTAISALMSRRGPDDEGFWVSPDAICSLVFRRLSILDLSEAGHQPMLTPDGRYALVFNGEIYNFRELRRQLEREGDVFRSGGDSEVVLRALARWGTAALDRFNGMFALAFYDTYERRLVLARDHAGIKPLYYLRTSAGVVFASQYDQILAHPWSRALGVSQSALALYLRLAYVPAPYGILDGTHMLEPGSWIEISGCGRIREGRYFEFPQRVEPDLSGDEALEAVDAALTAAVRRQLVSDVPVASFLSGGIDSPLVVAKMRQACGTGMRAFTIGTGGDPTDESSTAEMYARALGVEHTVEHVSADAAVGLLDEVMAACGEPFGDYSIFPTLLISRLAAQEFKVVLSGDGGDELFWGYVGRMAPMLAAAGTFAGSPVRRAVRRRFDALMRRTGREADRWGSLGEWQQRKHTHLAPGLLERVFPELPSWPVDYRSFEFTDSDPDLAANWIRHNEFVGHLTMVLMKVDRASMHHSLEVRVPLLDREVIETALRVDWRSCLDVDSGVGKIPLRRALARVTPRQSEGKRGFEVPMGRWLRSSLREVFEDNVIARDDILGLPVDRPALRAIFDRHLEGSQDLGWGLWPLLNLSLWEQRHERRRVSRS